MSQAIFIAVIFLLKLLIPTNLTSRMVQIPILVAFALISFAIYLSVCYFNGCLTSVCDINKIKDKIINKFKR